MPERISSEIVILLSRYAFEARANKSSRRREVYIQAVDELQRVIDGRQGLWSVLALYKELSMFELNATKREEINKILNELREVWEQSHKLD